MNNVRQALTTLGTTKSSRLLRPKAWVVAYEDPAR